MARLDGHSVLVEYEDDLRRSVWLGNPVNRRCIVFVNVNTYEVCYIYRGPYNDREVGTNRSTHKTHNDINAKQTKWKKQSYILA